MILKLSNVLECRKTLAGLDDCVIQSGDVYAVLDALYDLRRAVDEQAGKYIELYNRLLRQYGVERVDSSGQYEFPEDQGASFQKERAKLGEQEIPFERRTIPRFGPITPGQYRMLRDFFDFE